MKQNKLPLPIDSELPKILDSIVNYSTVLLKASPGSGKTTRLPWAVVEKLGKKVLVLEPRRLAAKLAAARISEEEDLALGKDVGYHFRFENKTEKDTPLIFYTEGTFLRRFSRDQDLTGVDVVILDEFHERHLDTDLALALLLRLQKKRGLKIVLMSATLDTSLTDHLKDAMVVEVNGITHPVDIHFLPNQPSILNESLETKVRKAVDGSEGDTLVFLPGMKEMLKVSEALRGNFETFLLHGDLSKEEQHLALSPSIKRKIILSTNIAESSVTIPGIRTVIDSGIQREAHYSSWNGLKLIQDRPITQSSAIQRAGRAGRTGPGECFRLYSEMDYKERAPHTVPEIRKADLTDTFLLIAENNLEPDWFEHPPRDKWEKARELLIKLGAIRDNHITPLGKEMLNLPVDARLARIIIEGKELQEEEKSKLLNYITWDLEKDRTHILKKRLRPFLDHPPKNHFPWEKCVLQGFPDQVARFRKKERDFIHYSGKTIKGHHSFSDLSDGLYLILDITQKQEAIQVLEIEDEWLWELDPFPFTEEEDIQWGEKIQIKNKTRYGSIVMEEEVLKTTWSQLSEERKDKILSQGKTIWEKKKSEYEETPFFERLKFWVSHSGENLEDFFQKMSLRDYFNYHEELNWEGLDYFFQDRFSQEFDLRKINQDLPEKLDLGGRRELKIHYPLGMDPYIEAPIQDFYGIDTTPKIMQGKIPLTLKLLGPHKRPIQITKDLQSFWNKTYVEMKKEYQRDYPRHYWPEKPWEARPYLLKSHLPKA